GFLEEVGVLAAAPGGLSPTAGQALGYRELLSHLRGEVSLDEARDLAVRRTVAFARRQWAWFRRDPRIVWVEDADAAAAAAEDALARMADGQQASRRAPVVQATATQVTASQAPVPD
ncbi:MAG: hypothetical protein ACP5P9_04225, partial [Acidimicrobiales bacterium]